MREDKIFQSLILLAHPDEIIAKEYQLLMESSGYQVIITHNIENFNSEAFHRHIDILLIDDAFDKDLLNTYIGMVSFTFENLKIALFCDSIDMESLHFYNRLQVFTFLCKPLDEKKLLDFIEIQSFANMPQDAQELVSRTQALEMAFNDNYIISRASKDGFITSANQNFCDLTGYDEQDLIGKSFNIISHPDTSLSTKEELWETILSKEVYRHRITNRTKLEDDFIVDLTIIPILDEYDEIYEFLCLMDDVTDIISLNRHIVEEKNAHEAELSQTKDHYLQVFSHELKTPLNSVINFTSYVAKQIAKSEIDKKERLLESLGLVKQAGSEIEDMVDSLLDLSKLKDGDIEVSIDNCMAIDIKRSVEKKFEFLIGQELIDVVYDIDESFSFQGDYKKIVQVCYALFSNAIKYGNKKIIFKIEKVEDNFAIVIEDNGPGIEDKKSVLELFSQGDNDSMTRVSKGTGVGLHYTSILLDLMSYNLEILNSQTLGGTKVLCTGPLHKE